MAKVCHSTNPHKASHRKTRQANWVENESEHSDSDLPIHKLSTRGTHPIKVKLQTQGKPVSMHGGRYRGSCLCCIRGHL